MRRLNKNTLKLKGLQAVGSVSGEPPSQWDNLVFVVGSGRCGSTLLASILASSPSAFALPTELNEYFHRGLYPYGRSLRPETAPILRSPKQFTETSLRRWPRNAAALKRLLAGAVKVAGPEKIVVVKSAMISMMVDDIAKAFPGARFVHMYRHALPVANSIVVKEWEKHQWLYTDKADFRADAARYWADSVTAILDSEIAAKGGESLFPLRYEALIDNPTATLKQLQQFMRLQQGFAFDAAQIVDKNSKSSMQLGDESAVITAALTPVLQRTGYL